jgi:hypothetical protein
MVSFFLVALSGQARKNEMIVVRTLGSRSMNFPRSRNSIEKNYIPEAEYFRIINKIPKHDCAKKIPKHD